MTICGVIFAAGEGTRLRPLTETVPKPLCPIGNVALLDRRAGPLKQHRLSGPALVAVNACYLADRIADHVGGRAYVSREPGPQALGTSGALSISRTGSPGGRSWPATPTPTWHRVPTPATTWPRCSTTGTNRPYGCCASRPSAGRPSSGRTGSPGSR
jgi:hypothetical protein